MHTGCAIESLFGHRVDPDLTNSVSKGCITNVRISEYLKQPVWVEGGALLTLLIEDI